MSSWTQLWLTGDKWLQGVLQNIPLLKGTGYYAPVLKQLTWLTELDLSPDERIPAAWIAQLPVKLHTLSLCLKFQRIPGPVFQQLPNTLTNLHISSPWLYYQVINLGIFPTSLVKLHINRCDNVSYSPEAERPALQSLTILGPYQNNSSSVDPLRNFLRLAPSITSYTGGDLDVFELSHEGGILECLSVQGITKLDIGIHSPASFDTTIPMIAKFSHAHVTLGCRSPVTSRLPDNITALTLHRCSDEHVALFPSTLTYLSTIFDYNTESGTMVLTTLPALRYLALTIGHWITKDPIFQGHFPTLDTLALHGFTEVTVPPSVTDLTLRGRMGTDYKDQPITLKVPEAGRYRSINGITSAQLWWFVDDQLEQLTSLTIAGHGCTDSLARRLATMPTTALRKLVIDEQDKSVVPPEIKAYELLQVCRRFTQLEVLHITLGYRRQRHDYYRPSEVTQDILLPALLRDINLRLCCNLTSVTFPMSLTSLNLQDTDAADSSFEQLASTSLLNFSLKVKINAGRVLQILNYLPPYVNSVAVVQYIKSVLLAEEDPLLVSYVAHRERYLTSLSISNEDEDHDQDQD